MAMTINKEIGIYASIHGPWQAGEPHPEPPDTPDGVYAAVVTANDSWFSVDTAGNVRGNPEAVEREALRIGADLLEARTVLGLARLAMRSVKDR